MQTTTLAPFAYPRAFQAPAPPPAPPAEPAPPCDRAELTGMVLGGLAGGTGLGYLGMDLGVRWGLNYGMQALGSHPAAQLFGLFTLGLPYAAIGAAVAGAVGITAGVALGAWLGGMAGKAIGSHPEAA